MHQALHIISPFKVLSLVIASKPDSTISNSRQQRSATDWIQTANDIAQTGIMAADLANSYRQTELMEKQLQQDYDLAMKQMQLEIEMNEQDEKLMRELNAAIVNVMSSIENRLGDISHQLEKIGSNIRKMVIKSS